MENMNYEAVNFNLSKHQNDQNQFNTHRIDTMYSPFNSSSTQYQSPVPSPVSQDPTLHSMPFTINQDKTPSNPDKTPSLKLHQEMENALIHITEEKIDSLQ